jgi:4-hydroxybenzoyl-CoA reductase subunit alpha
MYQSGLARGFGLTESQVQIKYLNVGGAFTGRGTPRIHHFVAAALSRAAARPVKLRASGDEEFIMYRGSGETQFKYKVGLEKSGRIKALDVDISYDCGAHAEYKLILFSPAVYLNWLYGLDAVRFKGRFIYTNNIPRASHHGGIFARMSAGWMQHLTHAAEKLGIDPVGFHLMNAIGPGHRALDGADFASCGLKQCIETVAARSGWKQKYGKLPPFKGIGIGIGVMSSGTKHPGRHDTSAAMIKIAEDGIVTLYTGIPDMGQGSHTAMGMIAAECLGITTDRLRIVAGDSEIAPFDMGAFSQRGTFTTGRAVLAACDDAKRQMMDAAKAELGSADVVFRNNTVFARGAPDKAVPLAKLVRATTMRKDGQYVMGRGSYNSPRESGSLAYSFGAQVAEVEIDPESGVVRVEKITLAHDIGRAINPLAVEGQLDGQVFSGVSQILYEECRVEDGQTLNPSRLEYKLPRTYELPKLDYSIIETIDPHGPFGAKEVGEGPVIVTMSAVACAVANALGGMMPEIPMTPWRVLRAIRQRKLDSAA